MKHDGPVKYLACSQPEPEKMHGCSEGLQNSAQVAIGRFLLRLLFVVCSHWNALVKWQRVKGPFHGSVVCQSKHQFLIILTCQIVASPIVFCWMVGFSVTLIPHFALVVCVMSHDRLCTSHVRHFSVFSSFSCSAKLSVCAAFPASL